MNIAFPYRIDGRRRTAQAAPSDHIEQLIEQVLFTAPGERVNRPTFGCGLLQLVFAPSSNELAAAVQLTAQAALQQWLGDLISVEAITVENRDGTLEVAVRYLIKKNNERHLARFARGA